MKLTQLLKENEERPLSTEVKRHFLEIVSTYNKYQESMDRKELSKITTKIKSTLEGVDENELPGRIPSQIKVKLGKAIDQIKDSRLTYPQRLKVLSSVMGALGVDRKELSKITTKIKSTLD